MKDEQENLTGLKRFLAVVVALALWWMSMTFSVRGFISFNQAPNPDDAWIGWTLAGCVTAFELIWNGMKERTNLTMFAVGLLAYAYGIITNIIGIAAWMGIELSLWFAFPILLGLVIEIAPEPSFIWGLTGNYKGGDFLGNLFGNKIPIAPEHKSWSNQSVQPKPNQYQNQRPVSNNQSWPKHPNMPPVNSFKPKSQQQQKPQYRNLDVDPMRDYEEPRY